MICGSEAKRSRVKVEREVIRQHWRSRPPTRPREPDVRADNKRAGNAAWLWTTSACRTPGPRCRAPCWTCCGRSTTSDRSIIRGSPHCRSWQIDAPDATQPQPGSRGGTRRAWETVVGTTGLSPCPPRAEAAVLDNQAPAGSL